MRLSSSPLALCARVLRHNMKGHPRQDPRSSHTIRSRSGTSGPSGSAPPCGFLKKIETSTITFNTWTSILLPQQVFFFFSTPTHCNVVSRENSARLYVSPFSVSRHPLGAFPTLPGSLFPIRGVCRQSRWQPRLERLYQLEPVRPVDQFIGNAPIRNSPIAPM